MPERFLAHLALSESGPATTAEALAQRIEAMYPQVPMRVWPVAPDTGKVREGSAFLLGIDDTILTIIPIPLKLPRDAYEAGLDVLGVWPGAAAAMAGHEAHVIVCHLTEPQTHKQALEIAGAVTLACAALATLLPVSAAVWTNAATIASPERLRGAAEAVAAGRVPLDLWIGLRFLKGPPAPDGAQRIAALTSGLQPFVGREIEWTPSAPPPGLTAERLLGTCQYLIAEGMVLADGQTLGVSASERIRIRLADRGQRPGIPVVQLTPEELDPAPAGAGRAVCPKTRRRPQ